MEFRVIIIFKILTIVAASKVTFEATPSELKTNLTDLAFLRCSVGSSSAAEDVHRVMSIFVTRAGQDVASVTGTDAPLAFVDPGRLAVAGSLSAVAGEGYIQLAWTEPDRMALGEYVCTVTATDARGHVVTLTSSVEVTAAEPTISDVIAAMKRQNEQQLQMIKLAQCSRPHVGFTATFQKPKALPMTQGTQAVMDKVLMNVGGAYDPSTGAFTCPTAGIYSFHIHVLASGSSHGCLQLQHNNVSISSAHAETDNYSTASTSAVLQLQQGDVVRAVVCYSSTFYDNNAGSQHNTWGFQSNIFNGHLVEASNC